LGAVAMVVLHNKVISEWYKGSWFILAISISVCSFPVGMGLSGLLLPNLVSSLGLRAALLSDAIPAGVALVLFALSYREPPHEAPVVRRFSLPGGTECLLLVIAGTTWMAYTAGFSGFISYLPATLTLRGYPLPVVGWVLTIGLWGNVIGTLAGGGLSLRLGRLTVFITGTSCLVIGMTVLTVTNLPIAGALVFGVLGSIQPGVVMAAAALSAKPENRAVGMGLFYTTYYVGNSTVPALCGLASDFAGGPEGGLVAATVLSAIAIPLFLLHRALANRRLHLIQI